MIVYEIVKLDEVYNDEYYDVGGNHGDSLDGDFIKCYKNKKRALTECAALNNKWRADVEAEKDVDGYYRYEDGIPDYDMYSVREIEVVE